MEATTTSNYKLLKRVKAGSFDVQKLPSYSLYLMIGIVDFQVCVINKQTSTCVLIEDYKLINIKSINSRLEAIAAAINNHKILSSNHWENIKLTFKSQKFTLVPNSYFIPEVSSDYLAVNSELKTNIDEVYYYKHIATNAVNIFSADRRVVSWFKKKYPNKSIQVISQGSAIIEGTLKYDDHTNEKSMFCYYDRGLIHIIVCQENKLLYYNQFILKSEEDHLKYIMLVFKQFDMSAKSSNLVLWGYLKKDSNQANSLSKYVKNFSFGSKPNFLKFPDEFEKTEDYRYFDLYSIFLCE